MERWRSWRRGSTGWSRPGSLPRWDTRGARSRRPRRWDGSIGCTVASTWSGTSGSPGTGAAWRRCSPRIPPSPAISRPDGSGDFCSPGRGPCTSPAEARAWQAPLRRAPGRSGAGRPDSARRDPGHLPGPDHPRPRRRLTGADRRRYIERADDVKIFDLREMRGAARAHARATGGGPRSAPRSSSTDRSASSPAPGSSSGSWRWCGRPGYRSPR